MDARDRHHAWVLAILMLGLASAASTPETAVVAVDSLSLLDRPDPRGYPLGVLRKGETIRVLRRSTDGWLEIEPPPWVFCWVEGTALASDAGDNVPVTRVCLVRSARSDVRLPGPPCATLSPGDTVAVLPRSPLVVGASGQRFLAIRPPQGLACYVAPVTPTPPPDSTTGQPRHPAPASIAIDPDLTRLGPPAPVDRLDSQGIERWRLVEAQHRSTLRMPMSKWRLGAVTAGYRALKQDETDPLILQAIDGRLDQVVRQEAAATAARRLEQLLARPDGTQLRRLDLTTEDGPEEVARRQGLPIHDAQGMLQPSNRFVDGQASYALIGDEGHAVAYVRFPPGTRPESLVGRQVGVVGSVRYDEHLRNRVIVATRVEPLSRTP